MRDISRLKCHRIKLVFTNPKCSVNIIGSRRGISQNRFWFSAFRLLYVHIFFFWRNIYLRRINSPLMAGWHRAVSETKSNSPKKLQQPRLIYSYFNTFNTATRTSLLTLVALVATSLSTSSHCSHDNKPLGFIIGNKQKLRT